MKPLLIVDDEVDIRRAFKRYLSKLDYDCLEAENGEDALCALASNDDCQIVLTDISMPKMDGLTMIEKCREKTNRHIEFIVFSGKGDKDKAIRALRLGVAEFLDKPMSWTAVTRALRQVEEAIAKRDRQVEAINIAGNIHNQLNEARAKLNRSNRRVARQIAGVAKYRDNETAEHCERVGHYSSRLAELAGQSKEFCDNLQLAAILHDIGKVGVPDSILRKPGRLSDEEFMVMRQHTVFGARMLAEHRDNPVLEMAHDIALFHHERWDGSGYPDRLIGEQIPLVARVCGIVDVYDALRTHRAYKPAFDHEVSIKIILEGDDRTCPEHFDPTLLAVFDANHEEFRKIYEAIPDRAPPAY